MKNSAITGLAKQAKKGQDRVTVTVRMTAALKRRTAVYAAQTDADLQDVVSDALTAYLKDKKVREEP